MSNDFQIIKDKNSVTISGKITIRQGKILYNHLQNLFENNFKQIKLNVTDVTILDSYSLGTIVFFHTILKKHNRKLIIINLSQTSLISTLFKVTNLDTVLLIVNDEKNEILQKFDATKDKEIKYKIENEIRPNMTKQYSEKYQLILENKELKKQNKKRCVKCKQIKNLSEFSISYCKDCTKKYYANKNQEKTSKNKNHVVKTNIIETKSDIIENATTNNIDKKVIRKNLINLISYYRIRLRKNNITFNDKELEKDLSISKLQDYLNMLKITSNNKSPKKEETKEEKNTLENDTQSKELTVNDLKTYIDKFIEIKEEPKTLRTNFENVFTCECSNTTFNVKFNNNTTHIYCLNCGKLYSSMTIVQQQQ